ncbi:MAG TPA: YciI family protein [Chitinophagaceae bacterium]|nr:YciI family protein [Chitinophagaceae bacterium]
MKNIFLVTLKYIKPHFAIDQYFPKHKAYIDEYIEKGIFICSGRKTLKSGEFILCKAKNRQEMQKIISKDPFDQFQLAIYEIEEYNLIASDTRFLPEV